MGMFNRYPAANAIGAGAQAVSGILDVLQYQDQAEMNKIDRANKVLQQQAYSENLKQVALEREKKVADHASYIKEHDITDTIDVNSPVIQVMLKDGVNKGLIREGEIAGVKRYYSSQANMERGKKITESSVAFQVPYIEAGYKESIAKTAKIKEAMAKAKPEELPVLQEQFNQQLKIQSEAANALRDAPKMIEEEEKRKQVETIAKATADERSRFSAILADETMPRNKRVAIAMSQPWSYLKDEDMKNLVAIVVPEEKEAKTFYERDPVAWEKQTETEAKIKERHRKPDKPEKDTIGEAAKKSRITQINSQISNIEGTLTRGTVSTRSKKSLEIEQINRFKSAKLKLQKELEDIVGGGKTSAPAKAGNTKATGDALLDALLAEKARRAKGL